MGKHDGTKGEVRRQADQVIKGPVDYDRLVLPRPTRRHPAGDRRPHLGDQRERERGLRGPAAER